MIEDKITYRRIQSGYWTLVVNGADRPVVAVRQGRNWIIQGAALKRGALLEQRYGSTRNLADAKSLMNFAWWGIDSAREWDRYNALEQEYRQLREQARQLRITYSIETDASVDLPRKIALVKALIEDKIKARNASLI
jgi:hypothetical protein